MPKKLYIEFDNWTIDGDGSKLSEKQKIKIIEIIRNCRGCSFKEGWTPCFNHWLAMKTKNSW